MPEGEHPAGVPFRWTNGSWAARSQFDSAHALDQSRGSGELAVHSTPPPMKIVIVEDQTMVRDLLVLACQTTFEQVQVVEAPYGKSALACFRATQPDLLILDLELPDGDGLDLLPEVRRLAPSAKIMVLSSHTDEVTVDRVMRAHVDGFVDKNSQPLAILREAVRAVMDGRRYLSPVVREVWGKLRDAPGAFTKILSEREQEVLGLIGLGLTNSEIAERLALRAVTVQNHRCNIMSKLGLHSTSHLIRYANEKGFTRLSTSGKEKR